MKRQHLFWLAVILIVATAGMRILRDAGIVNLPPNVAPIAALAMFGGLYLPRRLAFILPLGAMIVSDMAIGFYEPQIVASVYLSFAVSALLAVWVRRHKKFSTILGATLGGSMFFFLATNAAVWAFDSHGMYPHAPQGLWAAYIAGIPFLKNTILGDLGFTLTMVGAYELAQALVRRTEASRASTIV